MPYFLLDKKTIYGILTKKQKGAMVMATAYEISFKHEILNEFIASINGFIGRNYSGKEMPKDIAMAKNQIWDIYKKLPFEEDMNALNDYEKRLLEIRNYVSENTTAL